MYVFIYFLIYSCFHLFLFLFTYLFVYLFILIYTGTLYVYLPNVGMQITLTPTSKFPQFHPQIVSGSLGLVRPTVPAHVGIQELALAVQTIQILQ